MPGAWPAAKFDLIVLSELGYYLDPGSLHTLATQTRNSLHPGGTVLACHWRRQIDGCALDGDAVHEILDSHLALPRMGRWADADMVLDVWCTNEASVARGEGLCSP